MIRTQQTKIELKRQLKIIVALVCVVCFVAVFLISSAYFTNHTHSHSGSASASVSSNACQRTLMPVCECETGLSLMHVQIQTYSNSIPYFHYHSHSPVEAHSDCLVCVFIQKTVNQIRQFNTAVIAAISTDTNILAVFALCVLLALAGLSTPVKLKSRTNN